MKQLIAIATINGIADCKVYAHVAMTTTGSLRLDGSYTQGAYCPSIIEGYELAAPSDNILTTIVRVSDLQGLSRAMLASDETINVTRFRGTLNPIRAAIISVLAQLTGCEGDTQMDDTQVLAAFETLGLVA